MTYSEYVNRQKAKIKSRHRGEEVLIIKGEMIPLRPADEVLSELDTMDGLYGIYRAPLKGFRRIFEREKAV